MHKDEPKEIIGAQRVTFFVEDGKRYDRRRLGDEPGYAEYHLADGELPCHDCYVIEVRITLKIANY